MQGQLLDRRACLLLLSITILSDMPRTASATEHRRNPQPITVSRPKGMQRAAPRQRKKPAQQKIVVIDTSVKPLRHEMVRVAGGPCWIGSNWSDAMVGPRHHRDIPSFFIDRFEVSNRHWARFVDATGIDPPDYWLNEKRPADFDKLPVVNVSWYEATAYAQWAELRLPTEFEWEKAARGTDGRVFPWGHLYTIEHANTFLSAIYQPAPVGSHPKGVSPYGAHDMLGNVLEWTSSTFSIYPGSRFLPQKIVPDVRILRGVSWRYEPRPLFNRYPAPAGWRRWNQDRYRRPAGKAPNMGVIGFRCARDAPKDI